MSNMIDSRLILSGFLGSDASSSTNSINFAAVESGDKPMFLYGERKVSRRSGKFRRIQSAMGKGKAIHRYAQAYNSHRKHFERSVSLTFNNSINYR